MIFITLRFRGFELSDDLDLDLDLDFAHVAQIVVCTHFSGNCSNN